MCRIFGESEQDCLKVGGVRTADVGRAKYSGMSYATYRAGTNGGFEACDTSCLVQGFLNCLQSASADLRPSRFVCVTHSKALPPQIEGLYHSMFGPCVKESIMGISTDYTHTDNDLYDISNITVAPIVLHLWPVDELFMKCAACDDVLRVIAGLVWMQRSDTKQS